MGSLAVVGTFWRRPWAVPRIAAAIRAQVRQPDELWLMYEDPADERALRDEDWGRAVTRIVPYLPPHGETPFAHGINVALDRTEASHIAYLTDDSLPDPMKYELLLEAADGGAAYCSQDYGEATDPDHWLAGGEHRGARHADRPIDAPFCVVDHTQVLHPASPDRWPTGWGDRKVADGRFFSLLVERFGPLRPVPFVLDWTRQLPDGITKR